MPTVVDCNRHIRGTRTNKQHLTVNGKQRTLPGTNNFIYIRGHHQMPGTNGKSNIFILGCKRSMGERLSDPCRSAPVSQGQRRKIYTSSTPEARHLLKFLYTSGTQVAKPPWRQNAQPSVRPQRPQQGPPTRSFSQSGSCKVDWPYHRPGPRQWSLSEVCPAPTLHAFHGLEPRRRGSTACPEGEPPFQIVGPAWPTHDDHMRPDSISPCTRPRSPPRSEDGVEVEARKQRPATARPQPGAPC